MQKFLNPKMRAFLALHFPLKKLKYLQILLIHFGAFFENGPNYDCVHNPH